MRSDRRLAGMKSRSLMFALTVNRRVRLRVIAPAPRLGAREPGLF